MQYLGNVPAFRDAAGNIHTDPAALGALTQGGGYQSGGYGGPEVGNFSLVPEFMRTHQRQLSDAQAHIAHLESRLANKEERWGAAVAPREEVSHAPAAARTLDTAKRAGVVLQNSWNGLGSVSVVANGTNTLTSTVNRIGWIKGLQLSSDSPVNILITSLTIAGIPVQIGIAGTPLELFAKDTTRFSEEFSSRLVAFGQQVSVGLTNLDAGSAHTVAGVVIMDEASPAAFSRLMENLILSALV